MTDSLKRQHIPSLVFLFVGAAERSETVTGCPSCVRRYLMRATLLNLATANLLYPVVGLAHLSGYFETLRRGHGEQLCRYLSRLPDESLTLSHLAEIHSALRHLFQSFGPSRVRQYFVSLTGRDDAFSEQPGDEFASLRRSALRLADHYQIPSRSLTATFNAEIPTPGRATICHGRSTLIEINSRYREQPKAIRAILAHEVCHVLLHLHGLYTGNEMDDEILTDTAATFLGAGPLILEGFIARGAAEGARFRVGYRRFGYLSDREFGFVIAKRRSYFGEADLTSLLTEPLARTALELGYTMLAEQDRRLPSARRSFGQSMRYARARRAAARSKRSTLLAHTGCSFEWRDEKLMLTFPCKVCAQILRVPTRSRIYVTCPVCGTKSDCRT